MKPKAYRTRPRFFVAGRAGAFISIFFLNFTSFRKRSNKKSYEGGFAPFQNPQSSKLLFFSAGASPPHPQVIIFLLNYKGGKPPLTPQL